MSKYIPVESARWAEMVQSIALSADLIAENRRLKLQVEMLRKAGDKMHDCAVRDSTGIWMLTPFKEWKTVTEGRAED